MADYKAVTVFNEAHVETKGLIYTTVGALLVHLVGLWCMLRHNHSLPVHIYSFAHLKHEKLEQFI